MFPGLNLPPAIAISSGGYSILGSAANGTYSVTNQTQAADQISFTRGNVTPCAPASNGNKTPGPSPWSGSRG